MDILFVILGLVVLIAGGDFLLKGSVDLSYRLSIPKIVVGMTVVSFVTSAPELLVSLQSAIRGYPDLALGNVVGSNLANLGLVLGITLLIGSLDIRRSFYFVDWPVMMFSSLLFFAFIYSDRLLGKTEGIIMVVALFVFLIYLLRFQKPAVYEVIPEVISLYPLYKTIFFLGAGGVALWGGSRLLISGAVGLATSLEISERIIGISVVSIGTSIPELAASVMAMIRKEKAISVGNLIGSNIFNLLAVLGITAIIHPIHVVDDHLIAYDIPWMLGISLLILPLVFIPRSRRLGWQEGLILLAVYGTFLITTFS
ncbi:calcium/sodium antiporter [Robiginitalea aurantiaca]|uniref:Calcium/sodium antiporter n=1 Tax=Robiginitalea aurantiaca TaxID=3056915 RepID=A0ABT7WD77_9FLAO|nr:calcium/sodium antiporter [Robiginitalea aurantiaca]MDM9630869.1 calcium/sodium antiporter [Robiginitalea aurantiaca]